MPAKVQYLRNGAGRLKDEAGVLSGGAAGRAEVDHQRAEDDRQDAPQHHQEDRQVRALENVDE